MKKAMTATSLHRRGFTNRWATLLTATILTAGTAVAQDSNDPGILEPALTETMGVEVRIPHTDQADGDLLNNLVGSVVETDARQAMSLLGVPITQVSSPHDDLDKALADLDSDSRNGDIPAMRADATEIVAILQGTTQGRIYDGFAMLNYNRGAYLPDQVPGEYKMKTLRDSGLTEVGIDGAERRIWEVDVNMLWYDGQFDSDTFLLRVPVAAHEFDTVRVHYRIFSLEREDFAPAAVLADHRLGGSVQFPFKGFDSVWVAVSSDSVAEMTIALPSLRLLRGVYTWGWRVHPPRIQFLQPIYETVNAHTGEVELEPQGQSYAERNRGLSLVDIGRAAPEMKMFMIAQAALRGFPASRIHDWMTLSNQGPLGTWQDWIDLMRDQNQLPPEAWDILAAEGLSPGDFGPYRFISVYLNNEMYGEGPNGNEIEGWNQGDRFQVKLINLDRHAHYFRNVDFGPRLHDDISGCCGSGSHSFEIMNFKPFYGAPKVAEAQWRAGWGFRPHYDVIQQSDVFPRAGDQAGLLEYFGGTGDSYLGWLYSETARGGDFRFNPPPFVIGTEEDPAAFPLREADGSDGLIVGQLTEGFGTAKMCSTTEYPTGSFCEEDIAPFNPNGIYNTDTDGDGIDDELWFPPFLRNPNEAGGDILPPTPAWKPFLWINPHNGTLWIDPQDPSQGYWADLTYAHGAPIPAGETLSATIEAPRGSAQVFYQFDDLFHDNAIFSPHPTFSAGAPQRDHQKPR